MKKGAVFFIFLLLIEYGSALGVSYYHKTDVNFEPEKHYRLAYTVHGLRPEQEVRIYAEGDLAQYAAISPDYLLGGGEFVVDLQLPQSIEKPGSHVLSFVVEEIVPQGVGIGTAINIKLPLTVRVPYPGKYAYAELKVEDVNSGEPLLIKIEGKNAGGEDTLIHTNLELHASEGAIAYFDLGSKEVKSQEAFVFTKEIASDLHKPGDYKAVAFLDFGADPIRIEKDFRIGSLFVRVLNYTTLFEREIINKFNIEVESRWNSAIDSIYAEARIYNSTTNIFFMKTPSEQIERWGRKNLTGFFDTRGLDPGVYSADISLFYTSGKKSAQTQRAVRIAIRDDSQSYLWLYFLSGAGVLLIAVIFIILNLKRRKKWKRSK